MGSRLRGNDAAARLNPPVHAGGNIGVIKLRDGGRGKICRLKKYIPEVAWRNEYVIEPTLAVARYLIVQDKDHGYRSANGLEQEDQKRIVPKDFSLGAAIP